MDEIIMVVTGINLGFSVLLWLFFFSAFLLLLPARQRILVGYARRFYAYILSNLLVTSVLSLSMVSTAFEDSYGVGFFSFLRSLLLAFLMILAPLAVRIVQNVSLIEHGALLIIYFTSFLLTSGVLVVDWFWKVLSPELILVIFPMAIVLLESILLAVRLSIMDRSDRALSISFVLLPSLLPLSVLSGGSPEVVRSSFQVLVLFVNFSIFVSMVASITRTYGEYKSVMEDFSKTIRNEEKVFRWFTVMLISLLEARDPYTSGHSERVARYSYNLAKIVYNNTYLPNFIEMGALLHDIGKIGVRDEVLFYPSRLPYDMMEEMKKHPVVGKELLSSVEIFSEISDIAYLHHEKVNGTGYPLGIKGNDIPKYVKISTLADSFDAMNSARVYRKSISFPEIKREIMINSGKQFDKALAEIMISNVNRII